jgi:GNAT superfamily N-acetyltransferase
MFFYLSNAKFTHNIEYQTLDSIVGLKHSKYVEQITEWLERQWGYFRHLGRDWRREDIIQDEKNYFIVTYAEQPIGLFVLKDVENFSSMRLKELWCFYIDESFRGHGLAPRMMDIIKNICIQEEFELIVLDTVNPRLNKFYEKQGAQVVCDASFTVEDDKKIKRTYPTTVLSLSLFPRQAQLPVAEAVPGIDNQFG